MSRAMCQDGGLEVLSLEQNFGIAMVEPVTWVVSCINYARGQM